MRLTREMLDRNIEAIKNESGFYPRPMIVAPRHVRSAQAALAWNAGLVTEREFGQLHRLGLVLYDAELAERWPRESSDGAKT